MQANEMPDFDSVRCRLLARFSEGQVFFIRDETLEDGAECLSPQVPACFVSVEPEGKCSVISYIWTAPSLRRRGYAKAFLKHLHFRSTRHVMCILESREFWSHMGYEIVIGMDNKSGSATRGKEKNFF